MCSIYKNYKIRRWELYYGTIIGLEDILESLQFMSIKERIKYNVRILIYKIVNKNPNYLKKIEQVKKEEKV